MMYLRLYYSCNLNCWHFPFHYSGINLTLLFKVVESYTIGREQFGMEKEFIIEVVQNCPNPACRYYKNQLEMTQKSIQQHLSQQPTYIPGNYILIAFPKTLYVHVPFFPHSLGNFGKSYKM